MEGREASAQLLMSVSPSSLPFIEGGEPSDSTQETRERSHTLYFERQVRMNCAVHAANNFLQGPVFSPASFDTIIAEELPKIHGKWLNPYKSSIRGVGNYDTSVLIAALAKKGFLLDQFDRRKRVTSEWLQTVCFSGFFINAHSTSFRSTLLRKLHLPSSRHFVCIRLLEDSHGVLGNYSNSESRCDARKASEGHCSDSVASTVTSSSCSCKDASVESAHKEDVPGANHYYAYFDSKHGNPRLITGIEQLTSLLNHFLERHAEVFVASRAPEATTMEHMGTSDIK